jgi:hypothetical protein
MITVKNNSNTKVLFSCFNKGGNGIPFDTKWIKAGDTGSLKPGSFQSLSIGAQAQEGGRWIGGDPKDAPYVNFNGTVTFDITKDMS